MRVPEIIISLEDTRLQSMWYLSQWYLCFDLTSDRRVRDFWTESQALLSKTGKAFTSSRDVQFPEITLSLCVRLTSKLILYLWFESLTSWGLPGGPEGKEPACNAGDPGSAPGLGRFPVE